MTRGTKPGAVLAMHPIRLTAILTHPVQYYAPWFRHIAARCRDIDLTVLYATEPTAEQNSLLHQLGLNLPQHLNSRSKCSADSAIA